MLYGAAQFSRDTDIAIAIDPTNLANLQLALDELQAISIAVPPFEVDYLRRGMAVHFRCQQLDAKGIRLDVMHVMRGVAPFEELWRRRTTLEFAGAVQVDLLSLPDLVKAKKTQRDKDWPMIRALIEAHYGTHAASPNQEQIRFWLREARSVSILQSLANKYPVTVAEVALERPMLANIATSTAETLEAALQDEERRERAADREYWTPLFKELERIRHGKT